MGDAMETIFIFYFASLFKALVAKRDKEQRKQEPPPMLSSYHNTTPF